MLFKSIQKLKACSCEEVIEPVNLQHLQEYHVQKYHAQLHLSQKQLTDNQTTSLELIIQYKVILKTIIYKLTTRIFRKSV